MLTSTPSRLVFLVDRIDYADWRVDTGVDPDPSYLVDLCDEFAEALINKEIDFSWEERDRSFR